MLVKKIPEITSLYCDFCPILRPFQIIIPEHRGHRKRPDSVGSMGNVSYQWISIGRLFWLGSQGRGSHKEYVIWQTSSDYLNTFSGGSSSALHNHLATAEQGGLSLGQVYSFVDKVLAWSFHLRIINWAFSKPNRLVCLKAMQMYLCECTNLRVLYKTGFISILLLNHSVLHDVQIICSNPLRYKHPPLIWQGGDQSCGEKQKWLKSRTQVFF